MDGMTSHHRINVAKAEGKHYDGHTRWVHFFFATVRDDAEARVVYAEMRRRFPLSDGFSVTVTKWTGTGTTPTWGV